MDQDSCGTVLTEEGQRRCPACRRKRFRYRKAERDARQKAVLRLQHPDAWDQWEE